ncbi:MAG: TonB-dependent receptor [Candidatus Eisenbacteria bacterium]|nr:TonB-dependent receptor [Candidatus Eisenbacteria bacterium]
MKRIGTASAIIISLALTITPVRATDGEEDIFDLSIEELTQIVITSSRRPQEANQAAAKVYVITRPMIAGSGATSLDQILRRVPGFQVRNWLWGFTNTSVRGLLGGSPINERMLWLVDGVSINDVRDGGIWTDLTVFPLDMIDRIEVMPGPQSSMYGSNAFQGVINIITLQPDDVPDGGEFSAAYGRHNTVISTVAIPTIRGETASLLSASYIGTDEHRIVSNHSGKRTLHVRGKTRRGSLSLHYGGRLAEIAYPSVFTSPYSLYSETRDELYLNIRRDIDLSDDLRLSIQPSFHRWHDHFFDFGDVPGLQYEQVSYRLGTLAQLHGNVRDGDRITLGALIFREDYDGNDFAPERQDLAVTKLEVFGEYELKLADRLRMFLGASAHNTPGFDVDEDASRIHPRASALVGLTEDLHFRGVFSTAYRTPSWWHRYINTVDARGNPDLHAEELTGFEFGLDQALPSGSISATYFSQKVNHGILEIYDPSLANPDYLQYGIFGKFNPIQTDGEFNLKGVDISATQTIIADRWSAAGSYSYLDSRQPDGEKTPYDSRHKFNIFNNFHATDRLSLDYGVHYIGETEDAEMEFVPVDANNPDAGTIGRRPVDTYVIHELSLAYRFTGGFEAKLSYWGLGQEVYEQYLGSEQTGNQWLFTVRYPR